jgi:bleomycin hydrolase
MTSDISNSLFDKTLNDDPNHKLLRNIVNNTFFHAIDTDNERVNKLLYDFNQSLGDKVEATNQFYTGRCWIFAGLNVMRRKMIAFYGLTCNFELSQSLVFFYDKLEKCNMALEIIFQNNSKKFTESLMFRTLIPETLSDGGTWNMFVSLVMKYGIVPKYAFPDGKQAKYSDTLNHLLQQLILKSAFEITSKEMNVGEFYALKEKTMRDCYKVINICLGQPPDTFTWENKPFTPMSFYKKIVLPVVDIGSYVSICNVPTEKYNQLLGAEYIFNVIPEKTGNRDIHRNPYNVYYNVEPEIFKKAVYKCITKHSSAAWFACDFNHFRLKKKCILDQDSSIINDVFGIDFSLGKTNSILANIIKPNHAMVIVGCNEERHPKRISRWQVENSHGASGKLKGYMIMSDEWFDNYIGIAVVPKKCLPRHIRKLESSSVKWLKFWSYLGFVAK